MGDNEAEVIAYYDDLRRKSFSGGITTGEETLLPLRWSELSEQDRVRYRREYRRKVLCVAPLLE